MTSDTVPTLDDQTLASLGDRDPAAVTAAYEALADPLFRYLRSRCGNDELAADIVGATFVELIETAPRLDGGVVGLRRWMFTAARHNLLDEQRKERRRGDVAFNDDDVKAVDQVASGRSVDRRGERGQPGHADPALTPEEHVVAAERDEEVRRALAALRDDQREVLELRFAAGLSAGEIGEVMGRSPGAVRVLQHRALKALTRALGGRRPDGPEHQVDADAGDSSRHVVAGLPRGPPGDHW